MFEQKPKLTFFVFGLIIGLLIGGIVVYYNSVITNENKISVNLIPAIVRQVIGNINLATKATLQKVMPNDSTTEKKTVFAPKVEVSESTEENLLVRNDDEANEIVANDSIKIDTAFIGNENDVVVKKDELFLKTEVNVTVLDYLQANKQKQKSDSLLAIVSGTKEDNKSILANYKIDLEYWVSPIKYKGYKLSKNKLVVYGLDNEDGIKLVSLKNEMYLKYHEDWFELIVSNDFNSFGKSTNAIVVSQLNKSLNN